VLSRATATLAPAPAPGRSSARTAVPLLFVCVAGGGLSLQSFVNGRLGTNLGSAELAGSVSYAMGFLTVGAMLAASGRATRMVRWTQGGRRLRAWHLFACVASAAIVIVPAEAAPRLGVALLTVALVCGQATGSLVMDAIGLGAGGRRPLTLPRVLGVALALLAVTVGALGGHGDLKLGLLVLSVFAGVIIAFVSAALGQIAEVTGDPVSATGVMFVIGLPTAVASWVVVDGFVAPGGWSAPAYQWILGGLLGVAVTVVVARFVGALGVLVATLALVAGQSSGGVILDAVAPAAGESVTVRTFASVAIIFLAVAVSGAARRRAAAPAAEPLEPPIDPLLGAALLGNRREQ
jgi:transporter family-2 protein